MLVNRTVNPPEFPDEHFHHYSLPAFDDGQLPILEKGVSIKSHKFAVEPGIVLFSKLNPFTPRIWKVAELPGANCVASTEFLVLKPIKGISVDELFLICSSSALTEHLSSLAGGTSNSHQRVRPSDILSAEVEITDEKSALASASILIADIDAKIALNRRMNATMEQLAGSLFKSWFIDFDPVKDKSAEVIPREMNKLTAALFPGSFSDSELGQIPNGWQVATLDDMTEFVIGGDWGATDPSEIETVGCFCIRGADIPSLQSGGIGKMPTRFLKAASAAKRKLGEGDLVIEISGGSPTQCTGRPVIISKELLGCLEKPLVASNFCRILKLKNKSLSKFLYLWLRKLYDAGELYQYETGTTGIKNFAYVTFSEKHRLATPSLDVIDAFNDRISPLFSRIQSNAEESRILLKLRDSLVPKLLKGETVIDKNEDKPRTRA